MKVTLAAVLSRQVRSKSELADRLFEEYIQRTTRYAACTSESFDSQAGLLTWLDRQVGRTRAYVVLLDSRGQE
jgi:23S rRNA (pseudouridine1915-N3)-methyltransferase